MGATWVLKGVALLRFETLVFVLWVFSLLCKYKVSWGRVENLLKEHDYDVWDQSEERNDY
jgi:hypothetical protein